MDEPAEQSLPARNIVSCIWYYLHIGSRFFNLVDVLTACYEAAESDFASLQRVGFRPFVFATSGSIPLSKVSKLPEEGVPASFGARVAGTHFAKFDGVSVVDGILKVGSYVKYGALLALPWSSVLEAIIYVNKCTTATVIFSADTEFCTNDVLETMFLSVPILEGKPMSFINEVALCLMLCPKGAVILNTAGHFDDDEREIRLLFSSEKCSVLLPSPLRQ